MAKNYNKMEQSSMQQEKTIIGLEQSYQEQKEQLVLANKKLEKQTQVLCVLIQDQKGQLEFAKV